MNTNNFYPINQDDLPAQQFMYINAVAIIAGIVIGREEAGDGSVDELLSQVMWDIQRTVDPDTVTQ